MSPWYLGDFDSGHACEGPFSLGKLLWDYVLPVGGAVPQAGKPGLYEKEKGSWAGNFGSWLSVSCDHHLLPPYFLSWGTASLPCQPKQVLLEAELAFVTVSTATGDKTKTVSVYDIRKCGSYPVTVRGWTQEQKPSLKWWAKWRKGPGSFMWWNEPFS